MKVSIKMTSEGELSNNKFMINTLLKY